MNKRLLSFLRDTTSLGEDEIKEIAKRLLVKTYKRGAILLNQGEVSSKCYMVLDGCLRQYSTDEEGREITYDFFTERQAAVMFKSYKKRVPCEYYLSCVEDSTLIIGDLDSEDRMYKEFPELINLTRSFIEQNFGEAQEERTKFMGASPEQRYLNLLQKHPGLLNRVPQHQLASYLGVTPESLSRIKKRLSQR